MKNFMLGDCLDLMKDIPDGSVDMILADLPYGTTQNAWDSVIPFEPLWKQYWRVCKPTAAIVLTASQPFTSALIMSQVQHFKYCWVWNKVNKFTGFLDANKKPMLDYEDVAVFYKKQCTFNKQLREGKYISHQTTGNRNTPSYGKINILKNVGKEVDGLNPKRIIDFPSHSTTKSLHPTQKPVALFEYLIKTYTNEGETVLDNSAGSGTTAIAAINTNRNWICIEKEKEYYDVAVDRIKKHMANKPAYEFG